MDKKEGKGKMLTAGGVVQVGIWHNDKYIGTENNNI
jgi:hypothetical protein